MKQRVVAAIVSQFVRPRGFWGLLAGWEMALRPSNRRRNAWAVDLLDVRPTDRVVEIGFGPGLAIRELSRRAHQGRVVGLDHSKEMLKQVGKRNARAVRAGLVDLRLGSAEQLPDFEEPFDRILAVNNMGMWPDPDRVLKDLRRITSSGGRIAIVSQPRGPGANAETTQRLGREAAERFRRAGFVDIRSETLALSPPVVCVLGKAG